MNNSDDFSRFIDNSIINRNRNQSNLRVDVLDDNKKNNGKELLVKRSLKFYNERVVFTDIKNIQVSSNKNFKNDELEYQYYDSRIPNFKPNKINYENNSNTKVLNNNFKIYIPRVLIKEEEIQYLNNSIRNAQEREYLDNIKYYNSKFKVDMDTYNKNQSGYFGILNQENISKEKDFIKNISDYISNNDFDNFINKYIDYIDWIITFRIPRIDFFAFEYFICNCLFLLDIIKLNILHNYPLKRKFCEVLSCYSFQCFDQVEFLNTMISCGFNDHSIYIGLGKAYELTEINSMYYNANLSYINGLISVISNEYLLKNEKDDALLEYETIYEKFTKRINTKINILLENIRHSGYSSTDINMFFNEKLLFSDNIDQSKSTVFMDVNNTLSKRSNISKSKLILINSIIRMENDIIDNNSDTSNKSKISFFDDNFYINKKCYENTFLLGQEIIKLIKEYPDIESKIIETSVHVYYLKNLDAFFQRNSNYLNEINNKKMIFEIKKNDMPSSYLSEKRKNEIFNLFLGLDNNEFHEIPKLLDDDKVKNKVESYIINDSRYIREDIKEDDFSKNKTTIFDRIKQLIKSTEPISSQTKDIQKTFSDLYTLNQLVTDKSNQSINKRNNLSIFDQIYKNENYKGSNFVKTSTKLDFENNNKNNLYEEIFHNIKSQTTSVENHIERPVDTQEEIKKTAEKMSNLNISNKDSIRKKYIEDFNRNSIYDKYNFQNEIPYKNYNNTYLNSNHIFANIDISEIKKTEEMSFRKKDSLSSKNSSDVNSPSFKFKNNNLIINEIETNFNNNQNFMNLDENNKKEFTEKTPELGNNSESNYVRYKKSTIKIAKEIMDQCKSRIDFDNENDNTECNSSIKNNLN